MVSLLPKLACAAGLIAAPAVSQTAPGTVAPDVALDAAVNAPAPIPSLADLRGSAVLLEFWATWCGPCRGQIPHLNELHAKYAERGLVVLAVTPEERDAVERFAKASAIQYAIGFEGGAATKAYGVTAIPSAFLIDPSGVIAWAGHPAMLRHADVERVLIGARPFGVRLTDQLEPVQALLDQGHKGRAEALLEVLLESGKLEARAGELATAELERLRREAERSLARAAALAEEGQHLAAALAWTELAEEFEGRGAAQAAAAKLSELGDRDGGKRVLEQARRLRQAHAALRQNRLDEAARAFESLLESDDATVRGLAARGAARVEAEREKQPQKR